MPVEGEGAFAHGSQQEGGRVEGGENTGKLGPELCGAGPCQSIVLSAFKGKVRGADARFFGVAQNFRGKIVRREDDIRPEARFRSRQKARYASFISSVCRSSSM